MVDERKRKFLKASAASALGVGLKLLLGRNGAQAAPRKKDPKRFWVHKTSQSAHRALNVMDSNNLGVPILVNASRAHRANLIYDGSVQRFDCFGDNPILGYNLTSKDFDSAFSRGYQILSVTEPDVLLFGPADSIFQRALRYNGHMLGSTQSKPLTLKNITVNPEEIALDDLERILTSLDPSNYYEKGFWGDTFKARLPFSPTLYESPLDVKVIFDKGDGDFASQVEEHYNPDMEILTPGKFEILNEDRIVKPGDKTHRVSKFEDVLRAVKKQFEGQKMLLRLITKSDDRRVVPEVLGGAFIPYSIGFDPKYNNGYRLFSTTMGSGHNPDKGLFTSSFVQKKISDSSIGQDNDFGGSREGADLGGNNDVGQSNAVNTNNNDPAGDPTAE